MGVIVTKKRCFLFSNITPTQTLSRVKGSTGSFAYRSSHQGGGLSSLAQRVMTKGRRYKVFDF
jgi:hypothetical protein